MSPVIEGAPNVLLPQAGTVRRCERVTVTRVVVVAGSGVHSDPVREVTHYYDDDGNLVGYADPTDDAQVWAP